MKKTMYRVGAQQSREGDHGGVPLWLTVAATLGNVEITDCKSLNRDRVQAALLPPKIAMTWVQVLASRHQCVVVERVEVGHA